MSRLPAELLLQIFSYLSPTSHRSTFASLCCASKSMLHLSRPFLYSDLSDRSLSDDLLLVRAFTGVNGQLLGSLVRKVHSDLVIDLQQPIAMADIGEGSSSRNDDQQSDNRLTLDTPICLCLQKLNSLKTLSFSFTSYSRHSQREQSRQQLLSFTSLLDSPFLHVLTCLSLANDAQSDTSFAIFGHLMILAPCLQKLTLNSIDPHQLFQPVLEHLAIDPTTTISLREVLWDETTVPCCIEDFIKLLLSLPFIQKLTMIHDRLMIRDLETYGFDQRPLGSLTHFTAFDLDFDYYTEADWICRLSLYFPALQILHTELALDHGLPDRSMHPKLTRLILNYQEDGALALDQINAFLHNHPPSLQYVRISFEDVPQEMAEVWIEDVALLVYKLPFNDSSVLETIVVRTDADSKSFVKRQEIFELCRGNLDL